VMAAALAAVPFFQSQPQPAGFGWAAGFGALFIVSLSGLMMWLGVAGIRRNVETLNRYTAARPAPRFGQPPK
jgi:hypothetical protein